VSHQSASGRDQAAITFASERRDGTFDLACIPPAHRAQVDPKEDAIDWSALN
jgi:hypothetical protein